MPPKVSSKGAKKAGKAKAVRTGDKKKDRSDAGGTWFSDFSQGKWGKCIYFVFYNARCSKISSSGKSTGGYRLRLKIATNGCRGKKGT
jgi:hypothetical protein